MIKQGFSKKKKRILPNYTLISLNKILEVNTFSSPILDINFTSTASCWKSVRKSRSAWNSTTTSSNSTSWWFRFGCCYSSSSFTLVSTCFRNIRRHRGLTRTVQWFQQRRLRSRPDPELNIRAWMLDLRSSTQH